MPESQRGRGRLPRPRTKLAAEAHLKAAFAGSVQGLFKPCPATPVVSRAVVTVSEGLPVTHSESAG